MSFAAHTHTARRDENTLSPRDNAHMHDTNVSHIRARLRLCNEPLISLTMRGPLQVEYLYLYVSVGCVFVWYNQMCNARSINPRGLSANHSRVPRQRGRDDGGDAHQANVIKNVG